MKKFIVVAHRIPTSFNDPQSYIVEAETTDAAIQLVRVSLRDLSSLGNYTYGAREYDLPEVKGRIIGKVP